MIKKIVIGIDGSDNAFDAFRTGLNIAKRTNSIIKIVFVVDTRKTELPLIYSGGTYDMSFERIYIPTQPNIEEYYQKFKEDFTDFAQKWMDRCRKLAEKENIVFESDIIEGFPAHVLSEEARSGDLLVLGQCGENAHFSRSMVGSTSEELVRSATRPVLICPAQHRDTKTALFAYDGSETCERAMQFTAQTFGNIIEHVTFFIVDDGTLDKGSIEDEVKYLKDHNLHVTVKSESGNPIEKICNTVDTENIDFIIIGAHGKHKIKEYLLGSTTSHIIRKSSVPVLVIH